MDNLIVVKKVMFDSELVMYSWRKSKIGHPSVIIKLSNENVLNGKKPFYGWKIQFTVKVKGTI